MQFILKEEIERIREGSINDAYVILNDALARVYNKAVEDSLRQNPKLTIQMLLNQQARQGFIDDFMKRNPEFKEYGEIVSVTINEIDEANPGKTYEYLFSMAEPLIKGRILNAKKAKTMDMTVPEKFMGTI